MPLKSPAAIAEAAIARHNAAHGDGGLTAVARRIGYSAGGLSSYLSGAYPARPDRIEAAILARLDHGVDCPHRGRTIEIAECRERAGRALPMSDAAALRHWQACRRCTNRRSAR